MKLFGAVIGLMAIIQLSQQAHLKLTVYYESKCPDSRRFIINQLYPTLTLLGNTNQYFEAVFVPYGKASTQFVNGTYQFQCQHGNDECLGNKIHACALAKLPQNESFALINCMMNSFQAPNDAEQCAAELNINYTRVGECYNSWEGDTLLAALGIKTHEIDPPLYYVPWITYDDKWTEEDMTGSERNLLEVICTKLPLSSQPIQCR